MFGPRIRNVFKSRWHAVLWSASILLTAYCTVPSADERGSAAQDEAAARQVKALLGGNADSHETERPHYNPWAKDKP